MVEAITSTKQPAIVEQLIAAAGRHTNAELQILLIASPLGQLIAIADDTALVMLEFAEKVTLERDISRFLAKREAKIVAGCNPVLVSIKKELANYFSGKSLLFTTPYKTFGTDFQERVWTALTTLPAGNTDSYLGLAKRVEQPAACRAVARANSANPLSLIIPCHRVINSNGGLGGYAGGISRKQWLLDHELKIAS